MKLDLIQYRIDEIAQIIDAGLLANRSNNEIAKEIAMLEPTHCPWDCDGCHDDECPCDRMGCAGEED
jgi:hypothetical protein